MCKLLMLLSDNNTVLISLWHSLGVHFDGWSLIVIGVIWNLNTDNTAVFHETWHRYALYWVLSGCYWCHNEHMINSSSVVFTSTVQYICLNIQYVCVRLVLGTADADVSLQQYGCCLLYQCLLTDPHHYIQRLVHSIDGGPPLMCTVLNYLVDHDCEWGSVFCFLWPLSHVCAF